MPTKQLLLCSAVRMLLRLHERHGLPAAALAESLLLHLDACGAHLAEGSTGSKSREDAWESNASAWAALSACVQGCAARGAAAVEAGTNAAQPGSGDEHAAQASLEASACQEHEAAGAAVAEWHGVEEALQSRAWWWGRLVLRPCSIAEVLRAGRTDVLGDIAAVAAFMLGRHCAFCRQALAALAGLPRQQGLQAAMSLCLRLAVAMGREAMPAEAAKAPAQPVEVREEEEAEVVQARPETPEAEEAHAAGGQEGSGRHAAHTAPAPHSTGMDAAAQMPDSAESEPVSYSLRQCKRKHDSAREEQALSNSTASDAAATTAGGRQVGDGAAHKVPAAQVPARTQAVEPVSIPTRQRSRTQSPRGQRQPGQQARRRTSIGPGGGRRVRGAEPGSVTAAGGSNSADTATDTGVTPGTQPGQAAGTPQHSLRHKSRKRTSGVQRAAL